MQEYEKMPLISVIVPIYNIKDCLERCVRSILAQTYQPLEILLVDDGSTDGTGELCDALAREDERIRVFHKPNGGSSSARNYGILKAQGEYLGFVDSDDYIEPWMYEKLYTLMVSRKLAITQISRDEVNEDGSRRPDVCIPPEKMLICSSDAFMKELLMHRGDCSYCTKLVKRELFEDMQFPEGILNEDFYLLLHMLKKVQAIGILPEQGYHVFYRVGSNTRKKDKNDFSRVYKDIVDNADLVEKMVRQDYPDLKVYAIRFALFQRLDYMLHIPVAQMTGDNTFYQQVKQYLRSHFRKMLQNPYLTRKNKVYLTLLTIAPKSVRQIHGKMRGL